MWGVLCVFVCVCVWKFFSIIILTCFPHPGGNHVMSWPKNYLADPLFWFAFGEGEGREESHCFLRDCVTGVVAQHCPGWSPQEGCAHRPCPWVWARLSRHYPGLTTVLLGTWLDASVHRACNSPSLEIPPCPLAAFNMVCPELVWPGFWYLQQMRCSTWATLLDNQFIPFLFETLLMKIILKCLIDVDFLIFSDEFY